jgi:hypothetical protein
MSIKKVRVKPFGWPLSKNETETIVIDESVGDYIFNLHTHRYVRCSLGHLFDGSRNLCPYL